jgi:hypothetical protein
MIADHRGTEGAGGKMKRGMEGRNRKGKKKRGRPTALASWCSRMPLARFETNGGYKLINSNSNSSFAD